MRSHPAPFHLITAALLCASLVPSIHAADWLYLTMPGDTLTGIGQQYLKKPGDWPKVQSANGVPIPEHLPVNTRIKIPVDLLKVTPAPVTVTAVNGNTRFKSADGPFKPLAVGSQLTGGETVLTGPRSSSTFRFADNTTLTQQESSKLSFGRLVSYGKTGMVSTELSLDSGRLEASAAKQHSPAGGFSVRTPVAVAGLRGTGFRLNVDEEGKTLRNEVLEGAVAVSAQGKEVRVEGGYGTYAEKGKPPAPPRALLPAPAIDGLPAKIQRLPVEFAWTTVAGAKGYRAQVARNADFAEILLDDKIAVPNVKWGDELPDGHYVLRLRAIDDAGLEGHNRDHAFELDARPLPPLLTSPALGERLYQNDVVLSWAAAIGAQGYLVQISPTPEFANGVLERRLAAILRHGETLPDGEWHWRAASLDETGQTHLWGPHRAFRIQPLPGAPKGGEAQVDDGKASFAWGQAKGAARYGFEVGTNTEMKEQLLRKETDKTAINAELQPGKYYWRARGLEADGQAGAWSEPSPVVMPPARPTELMAKLEGDRILASWKGNGSGYRLELAKDERFTQTLLKQSSSDSKLGIQKPEPGEYWMRVIAIGVDGVESPATAPLAVKVERDTPWWLLLFLIPAL